MKQHSNPLSLPGSPTASSVGGRSLALPILVAAIAALTPLTSTLAQTANLVVQPVRITAPVSASTSNGAPYTATLNSVLDPVYLSVSSLPAGASASFSVDGFTATTNGVMTILGSSVANGVYPISVNATNGATNSLSLTFQSAHIWTGATFTNGGTASFSDTGNWLNGNVPGTTSDVVLYDSSAQGSGSTTTNILIAANTEIGSLRSAITGGATRRHNIQIEDGVTLKITGSNGLSVLRDRSDTTQEFQLAFNGAGGTLLVSNQNATVLTVNQANQNGRFLLDGLGLFVADVYRVGLSDQRSFPNWFSLSANGYTGNALPQQGPGGHNYLARTNVIKCAFAGDPNDWAHPAIREYSMVVGRNDPNGSTQRNPFRLGISNVFMMNSFCYGAGASPGLDGNGAMVFHPSFTASNPIVIFRGPAGMNDRMEVFASSDGAAVGSSGSAAKSVLNFSSGTVDMLVNRLYMARERTNSTGSPPSAAPSSTMTMAAGVIDANHVILGYQGQGNNLGPGSGWCQATINVQGGTFRVNQTLELGYTTADAGHTTAAESGFGQINVSGSGTLMASNITVGGVTKLSIDNRLTVSSGGTVIISNSVGSADKWINQLNMSDSRLILHVNGALTEPYVYATNLITSGTSNLLKLATVTGLSTDPQTVKLIAYNSAAPNFSLQLPAGLYGYLENDTVNKTINAVLTTTPPKNVTWNGNLSGDWNTTTANWQGAQVFFPGDSARFDDSAAGTRSVTVVGSEAVGSGGVTVSNAGSGYSFTGGTIAGTSIMTKDGAGSLTMDCTSQLPINVFAGDLTVTAAGNVGLVTLPSGSALVSTGSINGLVSAGFVAQRGTVAGNGVNITGGTFENSGSINGPINLAGVNALNSGDVNTVGISTIATNAILTNNGVITAVSSGNNRVTVNGMITGTGKVSDPDGYNAGRDGRLAVSGTIAPGINGIGTFVVEGRFDLNQNANLIIEVDKGAGTYDKVNCDYWGAIRGNIVMTNIGATPFAVGDTFHIVTNSFGILNDQNINPNSDFKFIPPSPGLGMMWDRTDVFTNGLARIVAIASTPAPIGMTVSSNQMTLTWPNSHIGWELQQQTRALTNGISVLPEDWTLVANSQSTNEVIVTINPNNQAVFYRLAHPAF